MDKLVSPPDFVIQLWTQNGPCSIQLVFGDITCLLPEDKVSLIMVSAFSGDYSAVSGTCIGALKSKLGISVDRLSRDKELDLRTMFSCWLSKPIDTPNSPYKRLLCFERQKSSGLSLIDEVKQMFRMFTPVFKNEENTVITPLLATGNQGHNKETVCRCMVEAAAFWINAGLPLRSFKIVIYRCTQAEEQNLKSTFTTLKAKLMKKNKKMKDQMLKRNFDLYVLLSTEDETYLKTFTLCISKRKPDIKLMKGTEQSYDKELLWQDKIFKAMITCKRVIVMLTPSFMSSPECLEQYNMALCCNRLMDCNFLIPIYLITINSLPTYMGLVQWIDTRVRKEGDTVTGKIEATCDSILESLEVPDPIIEKADGDDAWPDNTHQDYDVFISYSHRNPQNAERLLNQFKEIDPDLKVFYDRSSLTTGSNWQQQLYECMGECRCVILLLSPHYLSSIVCNEELNLAMARYLSQDKTVQIVPVVVEAVEALPETLSRLKIHDFVGRFDNKTPELVTAVCSWLKGEGELAQDYVVPVKNPISLDSVLSHARCEKTKQQYHVVKAGKDMQFCRIPPLHLTPRPEGVQYIPEAQVDIAVLYSRESTKFVNAFCTIVDGLYPDLNINVNTEQGTGRLNALDNAHKIVAFISEEFLESDHYINELHMALCRQRSTQGNLLYLIQTTPFVRRPFFPRILPYQVCLLDQVWENFKRQNACGNESISKKFVPTKYNRRLPQFAKGAVDYGHFFALTKVAEDVLESHIEKRDPDRWMPQNLLNVTLLTKEADQVPVRNFTEEPSKTITRNNESDPQQESKLPSSENIVEDHNIGLRAKARKDFDNMKLLEEFLQPETDRHGDIGETSRSRSSPQGKGSSRSCTLL